MSCGALGTILKHFKHPQNSPKLHPTTFLPWISVCCAPRGFSSRHHLRRTGGAHQSGRLCFASCRVGSVEDWPNRARPGARPRTYDRRALQVIMRKVPCCAPCQRVKATLDLPTSRRGGGMVGPGRYFHVEIMESGWGFNPLSWGGISKTSIGIL